MTYYLPELLPRDNASVTTILKKKFTRRNNQLQKRITKPEKIVISGDFKAKPNIIRQKDKRFQVSVDDKQFRQTPTQRDKNANCDAETRNHQPNARLKARKHGKTTSKAPRPPNNHNNLAQKENTYSWRFSTQKDRQK